MLLTNICTDGTTVWVNNRQGGLIGRFGTLGIDIHNLKGDACLMCTHERTSTPKHWQDFVEGTERKSRGYFKNDN